MRRSRRADTVLRLQSTLRLHVRTGQVTRSPKALPEPVVIHPRRTGSHIYLSLPDMAKLVGVFAWAKVLPAGSMLVTDPSAPMMACSWRRSRYSVAPPKVGAMPST